ncbi:AMP-binding protein [Auritidibacter ignavus]|uniref:AMP-binding protein n=1 Tax=Auritidibacter ignavus TaxID=678932 RepID=UPI00109C6092|nr:AMP-binding protein [Auritidibacter ignavus]WHS29415.1 AMP-binding protein [Auritidibacter ignavus]
MTELLTLSHAIGPRDVALLETTIFDNLKDTVERFPDREALVDVVQGKRWTYAEFHTAVRGLATGLYRAGIRPGERVGIWGTNRWEWTMTQYATAEIGAILVNINPSYRQHELNYVVQQAGITSVISSEALPKSNYPAMLNRAEEELGDFQVKIIMTTESWAQVYDTVADEELLAAVQSGLGPDDPINIQYTSGTTGFPKGATLTHRNILNNGYFVGETINYTEHDRVCIPVPFYHCFGMVMGNLNCTTHGATMVIPGMSFDPVAVLRAVEQERCTALYGVPTMFIAELALAGFSEFDLSSLRTGLIAGSPCPEEVMRKIMGQMHMEEISICYGMTETSPVSTQTRPDDTVDRRVSTVGRPGPHVETKIIDPATGKTLPVNQDGEVCTKGYLVMQGYWNQPEKTAEVLDDQGWMRTGDLGRMDEHGYVKVTGRLKDMVIRGGENIYPREIEEFLYTHPDILDAQVIGVPDEKYGEELMAWVQLREDAEPLTATQLREFCVPHLSSYKIPRYVHLVKEFPTTVTGKVRKIEMREQAKQLLADHQVDDSRAVL